MMVDIDDTIPMMIIISVTTIAIHICNSIYNYNYYNYIDSSKIVKLQVLNLSQAITLSLH